MMPTKPKDDDVVKKISPKLEAMFPQGVTFEQSGPSPENIHQSRFGFSMIFVGVIALIGGLYLLPNDPVDRGIMLVAGLACAFIGVWKIDRANRELKRSRQSNPEL